MDIKVGTKLNVDGLDASVIGYIEYANPADNNNRWREYRLRTPKGERWLSIDDVYKEYSISWAANNVQGNIGPEWHKVDEGRQVVVASSGDVDVDYGESANFVEFEDATEEKILSAEIWSDGTEYSMGYYLDPNEIAITGYEKPKNSKKTIGILACILWGVLILLSILSTVFEDSILFTTTVEQYVSNSASYQYVTSITGNEKQKANIYEFIPPQTTDAVAMNIIDGVEGNTESITQKDETSDQEIAIVTKKEYVLIYHPEDEPDKVYVQVSNRKYNYTSDNAPYKISATNANWYRSHYYSSSYSSDSGSFKSMPSAYSTYSGDTIHNIGNGYFDSYSGSVRQASINSRRSSDGGGK